MQQTVSATQARENFADIINRVMYRGEEFVVEKQGKPAVLITQTCKPKTVKHKKITGVEFLLRLAKYKLKGGPKDLAENHDRYTWE